MNTPHFIGAYSVLKRLELIDCYAEAFLASWTKRNFPILETAIFKLKALRLDVRLIPPEPSELGRQLPDTLRALAIAGPFEDFHLLDLSQQANLEHVHVGTLMETASLFLSLCKGIKRTLSLNPNGTGGRRRTDWMQSGRVLASSDRLSRLGSLKVYNAVDSFADPWFRSFAEEYMRVRTSLAGDCEYALHTAPLSLPDWDPCAFSPGVVSRKNLAGACTDSLLASERCGPGGGRTGRLKGKC